MRSVGGRNLIEARAQGRCCVLRERGSGLRDCPRAEEPCQGEHSESQHETDGGSLPRMGNRATGRKLAAQAPKSCQGSGCLKTQMASSASVRSRDHGPKPGVGAFALHRDNLQPFTHSGANLERTCSTTRNPLSVRVRGSAVKREPLTGFHGRSPGLHAFS